MWDDSNDKIFDILDTVLKKEQTEFPLVCPLCGGKHAHIYMYRWKERQNKGAVWVWCSKCKVCSHGTIVIPKWWKNNIDIELDKLGSHPDYLENIKADVDKYLSKLLKAQQVSY